MRPAKSSQIKIIDSFAAGSYTRSGGSPQDSGSVSLSGNQMVHGMFHCGMGRKGHQQKKSGVLLAPAFIIMIWVVVPDRQVNNAQRVNNGKEHDATDVLLHNNVASEMGKRIVGTNNRERHHTVCGTGHTTTPLCMGWLWLPPHGYNNLVLLENGCCCVFYFRILVSLMRIWLCVIHIYLYNEVSSWLSPLYRDAHVRTQHNTVTGVTVFVVLNSTIMSFNVMLVLERNEDVLAEIFQSSVVQEGTIIIWLRPLPALRFVKCYFTLKL